jgi:hypothetical protein
MSPLNAVTTSREQLTPNAARPAQEARVHDSIPIAALLYAAQTGRLLFLGFLPLFLPWRNPAMTDNPLSRLFSDSTSEHEKVRLVVIGSPEGLMEVMQSLHGLGYAKVGDWSPIVPIPDQPGFISVLTRHRRCD